MDTPYPDESDPDPLKKESILHARDFLNFEVGSPVLPNTYLRVGNETSQTRAAEKQSYLYDAIRPDWSQARVWPGDSLTITEVPVHLTRPIRYTVLFENLGDTISYKTQAPYTRIVFNEHKDPDTMICFLVTFLPEESYTENPASLGSDPSGSGYSGLTIYSHTDGTPIWGWRYDRGEVTHTLPFDEAYRDVADPDHRLWIGFGSDEYATRGEETWDCGFLDEVIVPGYKAISPPSLYFLTTDNDLSHGPGYHRDNKYNTMNDLGIGGGGGGNPGKNPAEPESRPKPGDVENDCSNNATTIRTTVGKLLNLFRGIVKGVHSQKGYADFIKAVNDNGSVEHSISIQKWEGDEYGINWLNHGKSATSVEISHNDNTTGSIHSHPNGTPPSALDLITTGDIAGQTKGGYKSSGIYDPNSGTYYFIHVENSDKAAAFAAKYASQVDPKTNWWKTGSEMAKHLNERDFQNFDKNEERMFQLADILSNFNTGMRLVKVNTNGTTETYGVKQKTGNKYKTPTKCK